MRILWGLFVLTFALATNSHAASRKNIPLDDPTFFHLGSVETRVIGVEEVSLEENASSFVVAPSDSLSPDLSLSPGDLQISNIFTALWDIIQKNKPVVNADSMSTSALPVIAKQNWQSVVGWKPERVVHLDLTVKNPYGMSVIDLQYDVRLLYGGNVRGKGLYIASLRVVPAHVVVLWGFDLDVKVNVTSVYNVGSATSPVAAINLDVDYAYGSIIQKVNGSQSFHVQGDGFMQNASTGETLFASSLQTKML